MNKLCVISIYVSDIGKAKEFYCEKLGFEILKVYDHNTVSLRHEAIPIVLCQTSQSASTRYPEQTQVVLGIETNDIGSTITELERKGVSFLYEAPQQCPVGLFTAIADPFGNVIELLQFA